MKDRGQVRALRRASDVARGRYRDRRRTERAARRARLLRGLEHSLFGSRMPDPNAVLAAAGWAREPLDAACPRCGTSRAPFEDVRGGCAECRGRRLAWDGLVRLGRYAPPLSQWTPAIKRRAWRAMALTLGAELGRQVRDAIDAGLQPEPDVVTYVPTHWCRRVLRGIDHGACLAEAAGRELRVAVAPLLVARLFARQTGSGRDTRTARGGRFACRTRASRLARLWSALTRSRADDVEVRGATVLLIDDVRTTGGTCSEAAAVLRRAGARQVVVACCAAVDPPHRSGARFGIAGPRSR